MPKSWKTGIVSATALAGLMLASHAHATVMPGTIIGVFSNVVTSGNVLHNPNISSQTYYNNSGTAVYSIANSTDPTLAGTPPLQSTGSALIWGDNNAGSGEPSTLDFFGAQIPADSSSTFQLGRITYQNGTSSLASLIFGATISFYDNSVSAANYLGSDTIAINTTSNLGADVQQDADYFNICGNNSSICQSSIEAIEISQGGAGVTVDLFGTIVGDPTLQIQSVALAPGQSPTMNGFIGSNAPLAVPEPASLLLLSAGLGSLLMLRRRSRG